MTGLRWGIKIPLRDGTRLSATLYLPDDSQEPAPCLFDLTPYTGNRNHPRADLFARHGFAVLVVDVRGRGNSEGEFSPFIQEGRDGHDIVEWVAAQPFCDGQVAMFGGSYEGYDQWATAKEAPPHLKTIVPFVAPAPAIEFPMRNNVSYPYVMRWITSTSGRTAQEGIFDDQVLWRKQYYKWYVSGRPFKELDESVGNPSATFREWLSESTQGPYWDAYSPNADDYARLNLPILTLTGCYDSGLLGSLHRYREHQRYATPEAFNRHHLVIGPWDHRGAWNGSLGVKPAVGKLTFGPASLIDAVKLHIQWYRWTMCGGERPDLLQRRVSYYVAGAEKWRYADTLESVTAYCKPLYLNSKGDATQIFTSGLLQDAVGSGSGDSYEDDPRDRRIAEMELELDEPFTLLRPVFPMDEPTDQTYAYMREGRALFYHSAAFEEKTEICGFFKLKVWISIDQPDADFMVTVYEITRSGQSILLSCDLMRARFRKSLREEHLVRSTEPLCYEFDRFTFMCREMEAGSRLRLMLGPVNSIFYQRNYNSGGVVSDESIRDARTVRVTVWHDAAHPSALYVPYGRAATVDEPVAPASAFVKQMS